MKEFDRHLSEDKLTPSIVDEEYPLYYSLADKLVSIFRGWDKVDSILGRFGATGLIGGGALLIFSIQWPALHIPSEELFLFSSAFTGIGLGSTALWGTSKGIREVTKYAIAEFMKFSHEITHPTQPKLWN